MAIRLPWKETTQLASYLRFSVSSGHPHAIPRLEVQVVVYSASVDIATTFCLGGGYEASHDIAAGEPIWHNLLRQLHADLFGGVGLHIRKEFNWTALQTTA